MAELPKLKKFKDGIDVADWKIRVSKGPILNSKEFEEWEKNLNAPSLPEMVFGNNYVSLFHQASNVLIILNTFDALNNWAKRCRNVTSNENLVKVAISDKWEEDRAKNVRKMKRDAYEWTFTTKYDGTILKNGKLAIVETIKTDCAQGVKNNKMKGVDDGQERNDEKNGTGESGSIENEKEEKGQQSAGDSGSNVVTVLKGEAIRLKMNMQLLCNRDPILFCDELILFQDELADNGDAILSVKMRVMPRMFLVLMRFFMRVDDVMFRIIDTRLFHEYGTDCVVREVKHQEATYAELGKALPKDRSQLTNENLMSTIVPIRSQTLDNIVLK